MAITIPGYSEEAVSVQLDEDTDIQVQIYPAKGETLLVAFPSEHGITDGLTDLARRLGAEGVEVWIADPFSTWFLPPVEASLKEIPVTAYAALIARAMQSGKELYLLGNDKGAGLLLESAREWQSNYSGILSGVFLISPDLYSRTPEVGDDGTFLPVAKATNLPVFLFVASKSTLALRVKNTVTTLEKGGSDVYVQILADVRNRFFFRPDATGREQQLSSVLPGRMIQSMKLMRSFAKQRVPAKQLESSNKKQAKTTGKLRSYSGDFQPGNFTLEDIMGDSHSLSQYRGKVVLVNFWASWCPPCVHEIPSMSELYDEMNNRGFTILAINIGESPDDIRRFMKNYPVNFPVLLDPHKDLTKEWKVFAFPTSYLLDSKGIVRYSVAGAIDWNSEESRKVISELISEQ